MSIGIILDKIWQATQSRDEAIRRILPTLTNSDLRDLCLCLLDATSADWLSCEPNGIERLTLKYRGAQLSTEAYISRQVEPQAIVSFTDIEACLVAASTDFRQIWEKPRTYRAASLLAAMEWSRDHVDSLLNWPVDMREREFSDTGSATGLPVDLLKAFATTLRTSEKKLAAA